MLDKRGHVKERGKTVIFLLLWWYNDGQFLPITRNIPILLLLIGIIAFAIFSFSIIDDASDRLFFSVELLGAVGILVAIYELYLQRKEPMVTAKIALKMEMGGWLFLPIKGSKYIIGQPTRNRKFFRENGSNIIESRTNFRVYCQNTGNAAGKFIRITLFLVSPEEIERILTPPGSQLEITHTSGEGWAKHQESGHIYSWMGGEGFLGYPSGQIMDAEFHMPNLIGEFELFLRNQDGPDIPKNIKVAVKIEGENFQPGISELDLVIKKRQLES